MFPSEHETRYVTRQQPEGGITPSRYDLALHEYMQKQYDRRQITGNVPATSTLNSLMRRLFGRVEGLTSNHFADPRAR